MLITIDDYYDVEFYNRCIEALKNNNVEYKEYISSKPPYKFFFEVKNPPTFINYDVVAPSYSKYLINLVKALKPNDDYIYQRRASFANKKAIKFYGINDALKTGIDSGEGIFFTATKDEILRISKEYPRKIYYFGKYFNKKYRVFFTDNLLVKNYIDTNNVLVETKNNNMIELEIDLNFKIFKLQDRLEKLSETPHVYNGKYYPLSSVRPELSDKYSIS